MITQYKLRYESGTQTIRTEPQNYCVAAIRKFSEGGSTDAAIKDPEALALVMAAAPEMLEALEMVLAETDDAVWIRKIQSIVDKAKGISNRDTK